MRRRLLTTLGIASSMFTSITPSAFASESKIENTHQIKSVIEQSADESYKEERIKWSATVTLKTDSFKKLTSYNNLFADRPLVTNNHNKWAFKLEVRNKYGRVLQSTTVSPGSSVKCNTIPANSGEISFYARAMGGNGDYTITID